MSFPSAAQLTDFFRSGDPKPKYTIGFNVSASQTADKAILLVDLSAAVAAEWSHTAGSAVVIHKIWIDYDVGSFEGQVYLGWVKENDGTDGTIYIIHKYNYVAGDKLIEIDFPEGFVCHSLYHKYPISGNYTVLQNDAAYGLGVNATLPNPAVGDLVLIYDYATATITSIDVILQYSII